MSRTLRAMVLLLLVAACGSNNRAVPRNLDDACAIVKEKPKYHRAFKRAERRWGVPVSVQMAVIYHESKFVGDARTPLRYVLDVIPMGRQSSAFGYSQALDATWKEYKEATGNRRAQRDDINDATDFIGWYMTGTQKATGVSLRDARNQYLAYHQGRTGYLRGTHLSQPWLLAYADRVANLERVYDDQLRRCRKR